MKGESIRIGIERDGSRVFVAIRDKSGARCTINLRDSAAGSLASALFSSCAEYSLDHCEMSVCGQLTVTEPKEPKP